MRYEVTIKGTLPTFLNHRNSEDCINLACVCAEEIIKAITNYSFESIKASYEGDGELTITIRKTITRTKPPTVGEMEDEEIWAIDDEFFPAIIVMPFAKHGFLQNLTITGVTPVLED